METTGIEQLSIDNMDDNIKTDEEVNNGLILNKEEIIDYLSKIEINNFNLFKKGIIELKKKVNNGCFTSSLETAEEKIIIEKYILLSLLDQIIESQTLERGIYYLNRMKKSFTQSKTGKVNDINLLRWKEYDNIKTDSLWIEDKRDSSGVHMAGYWGNFIPQIPHQMMLRYTKKDDWVLDTFLGSGTTLIECQRLGRNGIGVELNPTVAEMAENLIHKEPNPHNITTRVLTGDSRSINIKEVLDEYGIKKIQLIVMHPPYQDIIKFSDSREDLSNIESTQEFIQEFGRVVENFTPYLENGRYLSVVIGDKYSGGEWVPLGFYCMQEVMKKGYLLKSIIIKNFEETKGKRNQKELWRYRALVGGFYIFKHEYIFVFEKNIITD